MKQNAAGNFLVIFFLVELALVAVLSVLFFVTDQMDLLLAWKIQKLSRIAIVGVLLFWAISKITVKSLKMKTVLSSASVISIGLFLCCIGGIMKNRAVIFFLIVGFALLIAIVNSLYNGDWKTGMLALYQLGIPVLAALVMFFGLRSNLRTNYKFKMLEGVEKIHAGEEYLIADIDHLERMLYSYEGEPGNEDVLFVDRSLMTADGYTGYIYSEDQEISVQGMKSMAGLYYVSNITHITGSWYRFSVPTPNY